MILYDENYNSYKSYDKFINIILGIFLFNNFSFIFVIFYVNYRIFYG